MYFHEAYLFVFLVLHTYLQVARTDMVHNDTRSGRRNVSLAEETIDVTDQDMRFNLTDANEKNTSDSGFLKHVSQEKNKKHKPRKISQFQQVNSSTGKEENADTTQVTNLKSSLNTKLTRKVVIDNEQPCEAMVLTYGPIGFTSALELISNAGVGHSHSVHTNNDNSNSEDKVREKLNKRMIIKDPTVIFSSQEEYINKKLAAGKLNSGKQKYTFEGDTQINDHVQLNHQKYFNKPSADSTIGDSTEVFRYISHGTDDVNINKHIIKENVAVKSNALEKDKVTVIFEGNKKTQGTNNYSVLSVLQQNLSRLKFPSEKEDEVEQTLGSLSKELITPKRKIKHTKRLNAEDTILNKHTILNNSESVDKNEKLHQKQPRFINKITIDTGDYKNNHNVGVNKGNWIGMKHAREHFQVKTKIVEDEILSFGEKSVDDQDEKEKVTLLVSKADESDKSVNNENIKDKLVQKRYIPLLHPMSETGDHKKENDEYLADSHKTCDGSNTFDVQTTDKIKEELRGYSYTWPKTLEQFYSNRNKKMYEENKSPYINLPTHTYEPPTDSDYHLENLGPAETYDRNLRDPYLKPVETRVYIQDTLPHKSPLQYKSYHKEHGHNNVPVPLTQANNHHNWVKIYEENESSDLNLPIRIYQSPAYSHLLENLGSAEMYDTNLRDPYLEADETRVYIKGTLPHDLAHEPQFQYTPKARDNNYFGPLNQENNHQTLDIRSRNELYYHPIDYQYLIKKHEYQNSCIDDVTYHNEPILQENKPQYRYQQTKPFDPLNYQTNQQYDSLDKLNGRQSMVSILKDITEDQKNSKPNIKIFKVHFKPTDYLKRNAYQKQTTIVYKPTNPAQSRKTLKQKMA